MVTFLQVEKSSRSVSNLFKGIPFSYEENILDHILELLLLGMRSKGNLAWCSDTFWQVSERGFLQKISFFGG